MKGKDAADFGAMAVTLQLLTREQLTHALSEQKRWREQGSPRRLGELCLEMGLLTRNDILLVLRAQGKRLLTCKKCRKSYDVRMNQNGAPPTCPHCKGPLSLPESKVEKPERAATRRIVRVDPKFQHLLPGYEIVEELGKGGMGMVFKARDLILPRWVAVKLLSPTLSQDEEYIKRFFREAKLARKLEHPNIVAAYDCGIAGEYKFFLMEFVDGQTLDRMIERRGKIGEKLALEIVRQTAEGLRYAWKKHKIVHRDIKPQNLMLTKGTVKICDLGLSKSVSFDSGLTLTGQINCSPAYASPEQGRGLKNLDCRSDIYSLGVTLFEMVTGDVPFMGEGPGDMILKHSMDARPDARERNPNVSSWTAALIRKMMSVSPDDRPAPGTVAEGTAERLRYGD